MVLAASITAGKDSADEDCAAAKLEEKEELKQGEAEADRVHDHEKNRPVEVMLASGSNDALASKTNGGAAGSAVHRDTCI